jgi:hypothetical protein
MKSHPTRIDAARLFIRTIPATLNWLALISLGVLLLKSFVFDKIPEPMRGLSNLGIVVEGLLVSVLASYIFYLIVVHLKGFNDRRHVYPFIIKWADRIVGVCRGQLRDVGKAAGTNLELSSVTFADIEAAMKVIDLHTEAPLLIGVLPFRYANWYQYFEFSRNKSKRYFSELMSQLLYLDAELVSLVMAVEGSAHFIVSEGAAGMPFKNTDLTSHASSFFEYCQLCRALDAYLSTNLWHNRG